ncbi:MAG: hypothetical protein NTZ80_03330 [Patescibacteria group bacterium]|nr:hypothetical protein [Patescibacteria group bacterium]
MSQKTNSNRDPSEYIDCEWYIRLRFKLSENDFEQMIKKGERLALCSKDGVEISEPEQVIFVKGVATIFVPETCFEKRKADESTPQEIMVRIMRVNKKGKGIPFRKRSPEDHHYHYTDPFYLTDIL